VPFDCSFRGIRNRRQNPHQRRFPRAVRAQQPQHARREPQGEVPQRPDLSVVLLTHPLDNQLQAILPAPKLPRRLLRRAASGELVCSRLLYLRNEFVSRFVSPNHLPGDPPKEVPRRQAFERTSATRPLEGGGTNRNRTVRLEGRLHCRHTVEIKPDGARCGRCRTRSRPGRSTRHASLADREIARSGGAWMRRVALLRLLGDVFAQRSAALPGAKSHTVRMIPEERFGDVTFPTDGETGIKRFRQLLRWEVDPLKGVFFKV